MKTGKISEGIATTIELLESIPVMGKDIEVVGFKIYTAIKNLQMINEVVIKAENGEFEKAPPEKKPERVLEITQNGPVNVKLSKTEEEPASEEEPQIVDFTDIPPEDGDN